MVIESAPETTPPPFIDEKANKVPAKVLREKIFYTVDIGRFLIIARSGN